MNSSEFSQRRRKYYLESVARDHAEQIVKPRQQQSSREVLDQLTPEEIEALRVFSTLYGRNWRAYLRNQWMTGQYPPIAEAPLLQSIRNKIGPSGLCDIRTIHLAPADPIAAGGESGSEHGRDARVTEGGAA